MSADPKLAELAGIIREIKARVRTQYPEGQPDGMRVPLPDLRPVLHARDAAEGKVASIGSVNPRPAGFSNDLIQSVKRNVARALNWFVRDQIDFNRASVACTDALLNTLNDTNRALVALNARIEQLQADGRGLRAEASELKDIRSHWNQWREEWQQKLLVNEVHFLKSASELQAAYQMRTVTLEETFRESMRAQHATFTAAMEKGIAEAQERFWKELEQVRLDYERLIHHELRTVRQRAMAHAATLTGVAVAAPYDATRLAERFRGPEERVRASQQVYDKYFAGRRSVLDIGCGRGEFLERMRVLEVPAHGIDLDAEAVAICRSKGLRAEQADLFAHLANQPVESLDGIFCGQVVEHLEPAGIPEMLRRAHEAMKPDGVLVIETPNPESLAIFATHFYLDPTHRKPIPPALLSFYYEEAGFGQLEVLRLAPAVESMPELGSIPESFRDKFFGALDYAVIGRRL